MEVNDALIDKLATLARLEFQPEEKVRLKNDLQKMIAFVEKLQELDTSGTEPLLQMSTRTDVLREDEAKVTLSREDALKNAPDTDGVYFKVPKVIENQKSKFKNEDSRRQHRIDLAQVAVVRLLEQPRAPVAQGRL